MKKITKCLLLWTKKNTIKKYWPFRWEKLKLVITFLKLNEKWIKLLHCQNVLWLSWSALNDYVSKNIEWTLVIFCESLFESSETQIIIKPIKSTAILQSNSGASIHTLCVFNVI